MQGIEVRRAGKLLYNTLDKCRKGANRCKTKGSRFIIQRPDGKYAHVPARDDMMVNIICKAMGGKFVEWVFRWSL